MFTLGLGVSTTLGVLLPGGSVVWDIALAKPAIFGTLWSEDLLTLGKNVPRTPVWHF